jgi:uncharacterized protein YcnI
MYKQFFIVLVFLLPIFASAHVVVRPSEVGVGAYQTFLVSVPTEKDIATVGVRLVIPEGLTSVRPNVKPGWSVEIKKSGEGENSKVTELIWTGGTIPKDQRDEFLFSAKTPAGESTLRWDAYQTYEDGSVVSWNASAESQPKDHTGEDDFSSTGPYSETKVVDDLSGKPEMQNERPRMHFTNVFPHSKLPLEVGFWLMLSLIMSGAALAMNIKNNLPKN